MQRRISAYTFDPTAKTVTLTGYTTVELAGVVRIINITKLSEVLYEYADQANSNQISVEGNVITLTDSCHGMAATDQLLIIYDDTALDDKFEDAMDTLAEPVFSVGPTEIDADAYLDIQPDAGDEVKVETFAIGGNVEVYLHEGATDLLVDTLAGPDTYTGLTYRATNTRYYRLKNKEAVAVGLSAEGVYTKRS